MISLTLGKLLIIAPPLLIIEGIFSGSEMALLSADRLQLSHLAKTGNARAKLALYLAKHPERVLSVTLFMTSVCVISISALIAIYCIDKGFSHANLVAILISSLLIVLFGELIPKIIYQRHATLLAPWIAYPVHWAFLVFYPITRVVASYTTRLSKIAGPLEALLSGKRKNTREDIQSLLTYKKNETEIKSSEKEMIRRIFDFRYTQAKHALMPLVNVDAIRENATIQDALELFEKHRHSRMPVYSDRVDNIIGILDIADLITATETKEGIQAYVNPANYAAETQPLQDLLLDMRKEVTEMVIVVDEYGGAVGILTAEDIVEEVVGEINDEYDYETLPFKEVNETAWLIQASMKVQQINETLKFDLPEGNYETLSGFLLQQFGRIPGIKDELFFNTTTGHYRFSIQLASEKHIEVVTVEKLNSPSSTDTVK